MSVITGSSSRHCSAFSLLPSTAESTHSCATVSSRRQSSAIGSGSAPTCTGYLKQLNARENLLLSVPSSYLNEGIETILMVGTVISQRIWRKYSKDCKLADYALT